MLRFCIVVTLVCNTANSRVLWFFVAKMVAVFLLLLSFLFCFEYFLLGVTFDVAIVLVRRVQVNLMSMSHKDKLAFFENHPQCQVRRALDGRHAATALLAH